jgi:chromosomal replication initiator protein
MKIANHVRLWDKCLTVIKDNVNEVAFSTWFTPIVPLDYKDNEFVLQVPSQFFYEYIESKYIDLLRMTLYREVGEGTKLKYRIMVDKSTQSVTDLPSAEKPKLESSIKKTVVSKNIHNPFERSVPQDIDPQLNINYSFETFIEGNANKLARTACEAIAKNPGNTAFNPLFIHGKSGVGKTHLCHAVGIAAKQNYPEKRVLYVSANLFQLQYTDAVRNNTVNDFVNFYQTIDVLILDDVHEFLAKTGTQNNFFHIFNHLHQSRKQIILTSDRSPSMLQGFEERLLTRFKWGLTAELEQPDFELRKAILMNKIFRDGLEISPDVVDFIAENVVENVRDLEGVIVSLLAHSMLTNAPIDLVLAERVVGKLVQVKPALLSVEKIRDVVCSYFNLPIDSIFTPSRKREVVQARQIAMYLSKQLTKQSLAAIGQAIGKKDHATVLHALKAVSDQMATDKGFRLSVQEIQSKLKN